MKHYLGQEDCTCGKQHRCGVKEIITGSGAINRLPEVLASLQVKKAFLLADCNTWQAAGAQAQQILQNAGISNSSYVFPQKSLEPDEHAVGAACMHFDTGCDAVVAVGSGVINDIGKILSNQTGCAYVIVGTAPSMDGYASATSSMSMDGVKVSLNSRCADVIIGDTDILKEAPMHMLSSGLGDMLAKYVSITEWRIAHLITGEYYCEAVANLIRQALKKCVDNAQGLLAREPKAVEAVFEGLVIGGIAMAYAGVSRPASGVEHYFSHVWDMRGLEFGLPVELHGIQCAVGTLLSVRLYERLRQERPDWERAKNWVDQFSYTDWSRQLEAFLGSSAQTMIRLEEKEGKYDPKKHAARFRVIEDNWDAIVQIMNEELPDAAQLEQLLRTVGIDPDPAAMGIDRPTLQQSFRATKDIRDKYVLSRLAWDLGLLEPLAQTL